MPVEFVPMPSGGRVVRMRRAVGLADVRPDSRVRLDALAAYLQDIAELDGRDSGDGLGVWVLRRAALRFHSTPRLRAELELATWCSGFGPRWAERRTDFAVDGRVVAEAAALWVHVDRETGVPSALPADFDELWGPSANGRKVSARLQHPSPSDATTPKPWVLRAVDFDVLNHVNNAAYWAPVEEELARRGSPRVATAEIEFRGGIDRGDAVEVHVEDRADGFALWLCVAGDVRASALIGSRS